MVINLKIENVVTRVFLPSLCKKITLPYYIVVHSVVRILSNVQRFLKIEVEVLLLKHSRDHLFHLVLLIAITNLALQLY